jgi:hypothetical protein
MGTAAWIWSWTPLFVDAQLQEPGLVDDLVSSFELLQPVTHSRWVRMAADQVAGP